MCIIAYKTKAGKLDAQAFYWLEECFKCNRDGAGFMYVDDEGQVVISKGYMTFEDLMEGFCKHEAYTREELVFHFRIRTHGTRSQGNTHPFPISDNEETLGACEQVTDIGVMHNGVLGVPHEKTAVLSDTAVFVKEYLNPLGNAVLYPPALNWLTLLGGNKFAIMTAIGVALYGSFVSDEGWMFSNSSYRLIVSSRSGRGVANLFYAASPDWSKKDFPNSLIIPGGAPKTRARSRSSTDKGSGPLPHLLSATVAHRCESCQSTVRVSGYTTLGAWLCDACLMGYVKVKLRKEVELGD